MDSPRQILEHLLERRDLEEPSAARLLQLLAAGDLQPAMAGALLAAIRAKGLTPAEVRGFALGMRALARKPALPAAPDAIDIVGTGGDSSGSLNLSTGAALLTAACGVAVIKHGNRSITSRCGSADLVERLGLALPLDEQRAAQFLEATGFTFLFAPYFHPAMRALAPIRAALGVRTVFNLLGPLTNPAAPRFQLIGAYDASAAELIAATLAGMAVERAWVVHGAAGWDEATPIGAFEAFEVSAAGVRRERYDPAQWGLPRCTAADLKGADAAANLSALEAVFEGRDRGAHRDALVLQSGLALYIARHASSPEAGIALSGEALESGRAATWLNSLRQFAARDAARRAEPAA